MTVESGTVARVVASGTGVHVDVTARASNFTPKGTLYAVANDPAGLLQVPVQVTAAGDTYTFSLDSAMLPAGRHEGTLTLKLCADQACTTAQAVPSISVAYELTVLSAGSAWPGDNLSALAPLAGASDWATFQGNNAHTGYVPAELSPDRFRLRWKRGSVNTSATDSDAPPSPLVTSGGLLFASGDLKLVAYREQDGGTVWSRDMGDTSYPSVNPPAVDNGVVYMAAGQSSPYLYAFQAATGNVVFRTPMSSYWSDYMPPIVQSGGVFTAGGYGALLGYTLTGDSLMNASLSQTTTWTPAGDEKGIYAYTGDALTIFDPRTGAKLKTIRDNASSSYVYAIGGAPVIGAKGVYAAAYASANSYGGRNSLTRFDTVNGYVDWRVAGAYPVTPAYANGVLYAPNTAPLRVEARSEETGALLWAWTPQQNVETKFHGAPVVTKNMLFFSTNKVTYALDLRSQKVVWSYPAPGHLAISANGVLYIQTPDGLVAVNLK